jgi:hypothetical protein
VDNEEQRAGHWQSEPLLLSNDVVNVRMIEKLTRPGVKDSNHSDASADEPWIESQRLKRFGGRTKEEIVNRLLIAARDSSQLFR